MKTEDDVTLSGIVLEPERPRTDLLVDAMALVHGSGGNFYLSPSNPRAAKLRDLGIPTALFNTRGRDTIGGRAADAPARFARATPTNCCRRRASTCGRWSAR